MKRLFGTSGIITSHGEHWKQLRKANHRVLTMTKTDHHFDVVIIERLKTAVYGILDHYASNAKVFNIQDLMLKFTFDAFMK